MPGRPQSKYLLIAAAIICFAVAAIAFAGLFLREDPVGRAIFGTAWTALGLVWLGRLAVAGKRKEKGL